MTYRDVDKLIASLKKCELIAEDDVKWLCSKACEVLAEESNVLRLEAPITIVGDLHGQFFDLKELFSVGGEPGVKTSYLFLGDYVDRGRHSIETFLYIVALKVRYPDRIALIRGNHESRQVSQVYGFYDECMKKFGSVNVWRYCVEVFDFLSLTAVINDTIFASHGGLSPSINTIDQAHVIDRKQEIPQSGPMCDLMWSDPEQSISGWALSSRGAGFIFGKDVVDKWNYINNIELNARSHQLVMEGFDEIFDNHLTTVWSAPNYCYRCGNKASILTIEQNLQRTYKVFLEAPDEVYAKLDVPPAPDYFL